MANRYKNAQFDLTTTDATDIYTVPSESRAIIQNIHTANVGAGNVEIKAFVFDTSAGRAYQFAEHTVNSGNESADGVVTSAGTFSTKDAQHLAALLQEIVDALDYIADN